MPKVDRAFVDALASAIRLGSWATWYLHGDPSPRATVEQFWLDVDGVPGLNGIFDGLDAARIVVALGYKRNLPGRGVRHSSRQVDIAIGYWCRRLGTHDADRVRRAVEYGEPWPDYLS